MDRLEKELLHRLRKPSSSQSDPKISLPLRLLHTTIHNTRSRNTSRSGTASQPIPSSRRFHVLLVMARHVNLLQTRGTTKPRLRSTSPASSGNLHGNRSRLHHSRGTRQGTLLEGTGIRTKQSKTRR